MHSFQNAESPEAVSDLAIRLEEGVVVVLSHDELERSIEARIRVALQRDGLAVLESGEVVPMFVPDLRS